MDSYQLNLELAEERSLIEQFAAEWIRTKGMADAKRAMMRMGYRRGVEQVPSAIPVDSISGWQSMVFAFFLHHGLHVESLNLSEERYGEKESEKFGLSSNEFEHSVRIKVEVKDIEKVRLLWPWYFSGWCSGFSGSYLGVDLLFRVETAPSIESLNFELLGREEKAWTDAHEEPLPDYYRFHRSSYETRSLAMRLCLDRLRDMALAESPIYMQADRQDSPQFFARFVHLHSSREKSELVFLEAKSLDSRLFDNALISSHNGTLYISSLEAVPRKLQIRLLDAIQSRSFDFRMIMSGSMSLSQLAKEDRVLPGLLKLLQGFEILVPPLRMRMEDLIPYSKSYLHRLAPQNLGKKMRFSPAILNEFLHYDWPGGFTELKSVIQAMLECRSEDEMVLDVKHLPNGFRAPDPGKNGVGNFFVGQTLAEAERRIILTTLHHTRGNKKEAARLLNIGYNTLWRKLKEYDANEMRFIESPRTNLSPNPSAH